MISYVSGDLFQAPAQTLVNTVNTVGVMGKGIALRFKQIFPEMFKEYRASCERGELDIGALHIYATENKIVLNFPTKKHWRNPSKLEYIEAGLETFVSIYQKAGIHSVAFPPLGCGNGELDFADVRPVMERYLANLPIPVFIYAPGKTKESPEHRDPEAVARWLRQAPADLPFGEVWLDITQTLSGRSEFETLARGGRFRAEVVNGGAGIRIRAPGRTTTISREEVSDLWVQLRDFGLLTAAGFPAHRENVASHVMAVLSTLPYVRVVPVGDDFDAFTFNPTLGLQLAPIDQRSSEQKELELV